ncbi:MAG: family beta-propeller protein [Gemmatimonadales bacterium]|nr:family beta-propeller protein [Gemmatimonadales bacterium]
MKSKFLLSLSTSVAIAALVTSPSMTAQTASPGYHVITKIPAGGEGGWDYVTVDPDGNRLFLSRGTHAMVIDLGTNSVIGDIANTPGIHGVALAPELNRGFTSNGRDSSVTIFDYKTLAPITVLKIPARGPDAIFYDPATKRVFTFNGGSSNATAIDAANGTVVGNVDLAGKPEGAVFENGRGYANLEDKSEIAVFDPKTLAVLARWPLAPCEEPTGLAIDRVHQRLFAGCGNKTMAIVDMKTGKVVASVPVGDGVDAAGFDAETQLAFTSNGEGSITVVHEDTPDKYSVVETVPTQRGARTMAVNPKTHRLYTVTANFGPTPAPTADRPRPRAPMIPGSFVVLELGR